MTHVTVRNISPGLKSLINSEQRNVNLMPGDVRTIDMHPVHAQMLLKDASSKNPAFEITIDPEERADMEEAVENARRSMPPVPSKNSDPTTVETRFITDPKTVPDGPGAKGKAAASKKSKPKGKEARVVLKR